MKKLNRIVNEINIISSMLQLPRQVLLRKSNDGKIIVAAVIKKNKTIEDLTIPLTKEDAYLLLAGMSSCFLLHNP